MDFPNNNNSSNNNKENDSSSNHNQYPSSGHTEARQSGIGEDEDDLDFANLDITFDDSDFTFEEAAGIVNGPTSASSAASAAAAPSAAATSSSSTTSSFTASNVLPSKDPTVFSKNHNTAGLNGTSSNGGGQQQSEYILGTLIVRVVAARDLESVRSDGGGFSLFGLGGGGGNNSNSNRRRNGKGGKGGGGKNRGGTTNPYVSVRYGRTIQRTSEVFDTTEPTWPRGEAMYMDVTHPVLEPIVDSIPVPPEFDDEDDWIKKPAARGAQFIKSGPKSLGDDGDDSASESAEDKESALLNPILTVAVFHATEMGRVNKYPNKPSSGAAGVDGGDSDDVFLGMAAINVTHLLTGKARTLDAWWPLTGTWQPGRGSIRVVCEYEPSDAAPEVGDVVRFTHYCHREDIFPAHHGKAYTVDQVIDADHVLISARPSIEGWVSTFLTHRYMLLCEERHFGRRDIDRDEFASLTERIAHSPLIQTVQTSVQRMPDEGLLSIGIETLQGGASLLTRWLDNGFDAVLEDVTNATNWDGRHNPQAEDNLSLDNDDDDDNDDDQRHRDELEDQDYADRKASAVAAWEGSGTPGSTASPTQAGTEALPNMPSCPITGEPMRDPVVAADGHTYERTAIARWFSTSNKSPLTGAVVLHKNLVPNYMLLSSLQDAAKAPPKNPPQSSLGPQQTQQEVAEEELEPTTEINIDD